MLALIQQQVRHCKIVGEIVALSGRPLVERLRPRLVSDEEMPRAGQLCPGDTISFAVCTPREAMAALIAQERALLRVESPGGV